MLNEINKKKGIFLVKIILVMALSYVFLWFFSFWTTPRLKDWYGCDSAFFTMAGRGITNGWIPYKDFFDLKGPYFFFWEALTQLFIGGRTGAFIFQGITLSLSIVLIIKISKLFISNKKTAFVVFLFLAGHISTLWGGNTLEEYALPLNLLCIYLVCKDYFSNNSCFKTRKLTAFIIGISFGIILFAKVTVASPIAGIVLAAIVINIKSKKYKDLLIFLTFSFLGVLVSSVPVVIYFWINNCILEMLYSVFIFAFKRSIDNGTRFNLRWELKISGVYFAALFALFQLVDVSPVVNKVKSLLNRKGDSDSNKLINRLIDNDIAVCNIDKSHTSLYILLLCISITTAICFHFGEPFIYYFTTSYPAVLFAIILMLNKFDPFTLFKSARLDVPVLALLLSICYFASWSADSINTVIYDSDTTYHSEYLNNALDIGALIPQCDRNSVYSFNLDMQWFEINNILPCHKYQINLQFFCDLDNRIEEEIISYLETTPPKWIVVGGDLSSYLPDINDVVESKYTNVYENDLAALYLLNQ